MSVKPNEQKLKEKISDLENIVTDLKQSEASSRQACEKRIQMYMDQASDAMFVSDLQGRLVDCNRMACLSTGYTRAELLAMKVDDLDPEFVRQEHREKLWRKMVPGSPVTLESTHRRKDGTCFPVEVRVVKLEMEENQLILGLARDVTERRQAEAALRERDALYSASYESAPYGILVHDASGRILVFNASLEKITGYRRSEMPDGETWLQKLYPDEHYRNEIRKDLEETQLEDTVHKKDATITTKSGKKRICQFVSRLLPTGIRTVFISDITESRRTEDQLKKSESHLNSIFSSSPVGIGVIKDRVFEWVSDKFATMVGYSRGELVGNSARMVYPNDAEFERVGKIKYDQIDKDGVGIIETRLLHKNGRLIDVVLSSARMDPQNIYGPVTFTVMDISQQKKLQRKLRKREHYYRSILDGIHEDILVIGTDYRVKDINNKILITTGQQKKNVIGKHCYEVSHGYNVPCDQRGEKCQLRQVFETDQPANCLHEHRRENGATVWVDILLSPLKDAQGNTVAVIEAVRDVSDLLETQKELTRAESRMQYLLSNSPAVIYSCETTGEYGVTFVSANVAARLGWKPREFTENPKFWTDHIHPVDRQRVFDEMPQLFDRGYHTHRYRFQAKSGTYRWLRDEQALVTDETGVPVEIVGVMMDITEQRQQQAELHRLATAIAQADESVIITDAAAHIVYANPAFERITGYKIVKAIGENPRFLQSGQHNPAFYRGLWDTLTSGRTWRGQFINRRFDGTLFHEKATISPVTDDSGKTTHYVAVKRDITRELEKENQLRQAQKMEAIGTLAGGIAHDFNNILSAVIGYTELSLDHAPEGSVIHENLEEVLHAGKRATDLVRQILTFSRQTENKKKPLQINLIAKETLQLLRASLPTTIEIRQDLRCEGIVLCHATGIHQIVMNLCTNAYHAMAETGGVLEVSLKQVFLTIAAGNALSDLPPGNYLRLRVSDTGCGMSPETMSKIFDPYFTTKEKGKGTGLGLAVIQGIVAECDGSITVDSQPGEGTTVDVYLPMAAKSAENRPTAKPVLATGSERILFVDDEPPLGNIARQILEKLGYAVTIRTSSLEALELFNAKPDAFDLVITDMTMPHMTGDKLARKLLSIRPDLPVILCTGFSEKISPEHTEVLGVKEVLMKPLARTALANSIRQALDSSVRQK